MENIFQKLFAKDRANAVAIAFIHDSLTPEKISLIRDKFFQQIDSLEINSLNLWVFLFYYVIFPQTQLIKPQQIISNRIKEIINILDKQSKRRYTKISGYLLDLGQERENFEYLLERALLRQKRIFNLMPIHLPYKIAVKHNFYSVVIDVY